MQGSAVISSLTSFYRARFRPGSFAHNVLVMFTGTAIGQFGTVLLAPILTRVYSPDMFGVLGFFTAILTILSVLASLRYEMALTVAESEADAVNVLAVCLTSLACTTALGFLLVDVMHKSFLGSLAPYRWLLPVGFFCIGAYQLMVYLATRRGAFKVIARTKVYQGIAGPLSQILFALFGAGTWGLIIGFIIGQSTGVTLLFSQLVLMPRILRRATRAGMRAMANRFRRFALISSWSGLLEAAGSGFLLLIAIPILYSNTIAGYIFLADRIIGRPLLLISTSILQVYIGDISKMLGTNIDAMHRRFLQLAKHQFMIVACWLILVNLAAPKLFPIIFGAQWEEAVPYLQILSIAYLPQMVMHALIHTLQIMERQAMSAAWEICRFTSLCAVFIASYYYGFSSHQALLAYSVVQAVAQIILFFLMYYSIQTLRKGQSHV